MIPVEVTQAPWHFTSVPDALDHWQSLAAGFVALLAALFAVFGAEVFARCKERREIQALRAMLAVEIRSFLNVLIEIHQSLTLMEFPSGESVMSAAEPPRPTVYPATADRIGALGPLAEDVTAFYTTLEWVRVRVNILGSVFGGNCPPRAQVKRLAAAFEHACRGNLPLLSKLPPDPSDAKIRAKVESMGKRDDGELPAR